MSPLEVFEVQKAAYFKNGEINLNRRIEILKKLIEILVDNQAAICDALNEDFSTRCTELTRFTDINAGISGLKHSLAHINKWVKPKTSLPTPAILALLGAKTFVKYQAKGIIGIISPWNFPINLTFSPLANIIAAGNRAMIKPSEFTPKTSQLLKDLFDINFPASEIAICVGDSEIGQEFSKLPFDHLIFTGATSIGRKIMAAASENLVPVTLELGGKSPVILDRDFDETLALTRILAGKYMNSGQVCLAPDYIFVPEERLDLIINKIQDITKVMYPNIISNPEYTAIINDRHFSRLQNYIDEASSKNLKIIQINPDNEDFSLNNSRKILPTLIINPDDNLKIMQDEIFGPILPIKTYKNINETIEYINSKPRPLALYYFSNDKNNQNMVINKTISGGVTINDVILHIAMEELPFGGVGASGIGAYHGHRGFLEFSHQKAIFAQAKGDNFLLKATRPPYGKILNKYLNFMIRK